VRTYFSKVMHHLLDAQLVANTAVAHVLITTVDVALLLIDNYNESCIIMAWSADTL
jgi:hypothetical protein